MSIASDTKLAELEQRLQTAEEKIAWLEKSLEELRETVKKGKRG